MQYIHAWIVISTASADPKNAMNAELQIPRKSGNREVFVQVARGRNPVFTVASSYDPHSSNSLLDYFAFSFAPKRIMFFNKPVLTALAGAILAFAGEATATCNPSSLNTTSFNYVNDVANQTVHQIAKKFNRGVCDIGRANLS